MNSWLAGYGGILRQMNGDNFDFLLNVLLQRRFVRKTEMLKEKHGKSRVG